MSTVLVQSLIWLGSGLCIGSLGLLARLCPPTWRKFKLPLIGALTALCIGWLATWLFGSYLATTIMLWMTILVIVATPQGVSRFYQVKK